MSSAGGKTKPTKEEIAQILADKAAKKAAKQERRADSWQSKVPETTPQERYDRDQKLCWKEVVDARCKKSDWEFVFGTFESKREQIVSACSSLRIDQIEDAIRYNKENRRWYDGNVSKEHTADWLLQQAVSFQKSSKVQMSEEAQFLMAQALQPQSRPEQAKIDAILEFHSFQKERLERCLQEATARDNHNVPRDFMTCLDGIFPKSHMSERQALLLYCTTVKILVGGIEFSPPSCDTAINVRYHVHMQLENRRNVDGSIAVRAKHCAEGDMNCLDCAGVQAHNVLLLHNHMFAEAVRKMLHSLLSGHDTALEAFLKFCEIQCKSKFEPKYTGVPEFYLFLRYRSLIKMLIPEFAVRTNPCLKVTRFSEEHRGEIVRLILEKLGMTMEQVDLHVAAFLTNPSEFPTRK